MSDFISTRDRVRVMFAALHGRVVGTFKTCRRHWEMSGFESKADLGQNLPDLVKCFLHTIPKAHV